MYRDAVPTQSILTITSNVEYGKATGAFPSGHKKGTLYAPGANPENGMDSHGMLPSMFSVGKIDYNDALDGISLTNTITPDGLGRDEEERIGNLVGIRTPATATACTTPTSTCCARSSSRMPSSIRRSTRT